MALYMYHDIEGDLTNKNAISYSKFEFENVIIQPRSIKFDLNFFSTYFRYN